MLLHLYVSRTTRTPRVASVDCSDTSVLVRGPFDPQRYVAIVVQVCIMVVQSSRFTAFRDIDFGGGFVLSHVCILKSLSFRRIG